MPVRNARRTGRFRALNPPAAPPHASLKAGGSAFDAAIADLVARGRLWVI